MGGQDSRLHRDWERVQRVTQLREQGLSHAEIGERVGMTRQGVAKLLKQTRSQTEALRILCQSCGSLIGVIHERGGRTREGLCLNCLAKRPKATLGQRLRAARLAAGLTQKELGKRIGEDRKIIAELEKRRTPSAKPERVELVKKLAGVLGVEWGVLMGTMGKQVSEMRTPL